MKIDLRPELLLENEKSSGNNPVTSATEEDDDEWPTVVPAVTLRSVESVAELLLCPEKIDYLLLLHDPTKQDVDGCSLGGVGPSVRLNTAREQLRRLKLHRPTPTGEGQLVLFELPIHTRPPRSLILGSSEKNSPLNRWVEYAKEDYRRVALLIDNIVNTHQRPDSSGGKERINIALLSICSGLENRSTVAYQCYFTWLLSNSWGSESRATLFYQKTATRPAVDVPNARFNVENEPANPPLQEYFKDLIVPALALEYEVLWTGATHLRYDLMEVDEQQKVEGRGEALLKRIQLEPCTKQTAVDGLEGKKDFPRYYVLLYDTKTSFASQLEQLPAPLSAVRSCLPYRIERGNDCLRQTEECYRNMPDTILHWLEELEDDDANSLTPIHVGVVNICNSAMLNCERNDEGDLVKQSILSVLLKRANGSLYAAWNTLSSLWNSTDTNSDDENAEKKEHDGLGSDFKTTVLPKLIKTFSPDIDI